ncbi:hypothetical protein AKJ63_00510 [candidate division MSBL1 archaeon SCGC-AAA259D18]|uniref:Nickel/cobalt efflux system n=1 Tax=candidate division MSBL1 archaeon SCGC-AAA259D18 TaxID=1698262 RepID=A0A133UCH1_9EURY|nr:hypothetical protein AKJ63_00510 [candidate division MSBL1 archaeon SCGC-AAA259D18]
MVMGLLGVVTVSGVLGVTHGLEPDHLAGIVSLTSGAGTSRSPAVIGTVFASGHVLLVIAWLVAAHFLAGYIPLGGSLKTVGPVITGTVLTVLGVGLGVAGARKLIHRHSHTHERGRHEHYHLHLPFIRGDLHGFASGHSHEHAKKDYLKIGVVGALFTLSPPLSMIAFISLTLTASGGATVALAVAVYSIAIMSTMGLMGGGVGKLFNIVRTENEQIHAIIQCLASVVIITLAGYLLNHNLVALL